jgi:hypothetical protein
MHDKSPPRFELETFHRDVSDDDLIADLVRVSDELGKKRITFRDYNTTGKFSSSTISTRFGSWLNALEKAGLEKTIERNISSEALFRNIVEVWSKLGRQPKTRDLSVEISAYSSSTYADRFGGWRKALHQFVEWANDKNVPMEPRDELDLKSRKTPRNVNWRLRAQVLMRDSAKCRLCGATPADGAKLHVDHIQPWSKGGETIIGNLQILCETCNIGKGDLAG